MSNDNKSEIKNQKSKILYLFTRTPLHVGAGASVGAIDQPIVRERHTGFPIIPASSLKGTFADAWNDVLESGDKGGRKRGKSDAAWLFGSDDANHACAGALQFSEGKLLAFPIRSAKGSFAWITCPLILRRAVRDQALRIKLDTLKTPDDDKAYYNGGNGSPLDLGGKVVLEEYTFNQAGPLLNGLGDALAELLKGADGQSDPVWQEVASRLVILSDGMMSFFAQNACEVAQHVRISDETGTAEGGALFNQENVPSETLFYSVVHFFQGRGKDFSGKSADDAEKAFEDKISGKPFQFGGDASTGLGYCTVKLC